MRLRRSELSSPGIKRQRRGRGFRYLAPDGSPVTEPDVLERIHDLVIPPAWRRVWICPHPTGHIQAVGTDDAGRRQYLYHPEWRRARDEEKHDRVLALASELPNVRAALQEDLRRRDLDRLRVSAAALRMIDRGVFRSGGEEYAETNGSHGATTLLREHVKISGDELTFCYPAKSGLVRTLSMRDGELATVLQSLRRCRTGTSRLFVYRTADGWHELHASDVNQRFKELAGEEFTVKDLRTWHATVLAAVFLAAQETPTSQRGTAKAEAAAIKEVAEELGNTPAVARRSYVDPRVLREFERRTTIRHAVRKADADGLAEEELRDRMEKAVIRLLRRASRK